MLKKLRRQKVIYLKMMQPSLIFVKAQTFSKKFYSKLASNLVKKISVISPNKFNSNVPKITLLIYLTIKKASFSYSVLLKCQ